MQTSTFFRVVAGLMLIVALAGCEGLSGDSAEGTAEVFQNLSFKDAGDRASSEQKVVLVDYTASWCPPCKMMERETWPDKDVVAWIDEHAIAIQVDFDQTKRLAGEQQVGALPTIILYRDGKELARIEGGRDPTQLLAWLNDNVG